jgi:hypothetical protein
MLPDRALAHPRSLGKTLRRNLVAYLFLAPYLFIIGVFSIGAGLFGLLLSL